MDKLKVGDMIQVAVDNTVIILNFFGSLKILFFRQVMMKLFHFYIDYPIFMQVEFKFLMELEIKSPQHFIHRIKCSDPKNIQQVFAIEIAVGDCLLKKTTEGSFIPLQVTVISTVEEKSVYSSMTESGGILVNDIQASCLSFCSI